MLVVRIDIGMSTGKTAAQAAHASLESYKKAVSNRKLWVKRWEACGCKKVVLAAGSLELLKDLHKRAESLRIPCALIKDAGMTEIAPGTTTALGIGPAPETKIDIITGKLAVL